MQDAIIWVLAAVGGALLYMLPSVVAGIRQHRSFMMILLLNALLGWTFVGYVVCMVWAFTGRTRRDIERERV